MQIALSLTINLTTKKGFFTDITDYAGSNVNVALLNATGSVDYSEQGTLLGTLPINLGGAPSTRVSPEFDLVLDANGEVANISYSAVYTVSYNFTTLTEGAAPDEIFIGSGTFGSSYQGFPAGTTIVIPSISPSPGKIVSTSVDDSNILLLTTTTSVSNVSLASRAVNATLPSSNFAWTYAGCNLVESKSSLVADCDYGDFGTFTVSNETNVTGVTINDLTAEISYPGWTNQALITVTSLPYTNNTLATGTYSVTLTQEIEKDMGGDLIVNYTSESVQEFKVSCIGSLCGINDCIENLRKAHEQELLANKISKYQVYVDNILMYYMEAQNYRACGEMDKYRLEIDKIEQQLDASGCDCGCCDEDQYKWVQNTSADAINILAAITQLQEDVDAVENDITIIQGDVSELQIDLNTVETTAVFTANNGITKSGTNVELGGTLTKNTTINTSTFDFIVSSAPTGDFIINKTATSATAQTTVLTLKETYSAPFQSGSGINIDFVSDAGGFNYAKIFAKYLDAGNNTAFSFCVANDGDPADTSFPAFEIYTDPVDLLYKIKANNYGDGNIVDNTVSYLLGVKTDGNIVEVAKSTLGTVTAANNGLTLSGTTAKLGGALNQATTITVSNTNTLTLSGILSVTGTYNKTLVVDSAGKIFAATPSPEVRVNAYIVRQTGTSAPTIDETLKEDVPSVTFTYANLGYYGIQLPSSIPFGKTVVTITSYGDPSGKAAITQSVEYPANLATSLGKLYTADVNGLLANGLLNAIIKFEFYS